MMTNPELFLPRAHRMAIGSLKLTSGYLWKYKLHLCVDILPPIIPLYSQPNLGKGVCSVSLNPCPMIGSEVKVIPLPPFLSISGSIQASQESQLHYPMVPESKEKYCHAYGSSP